MKFVHIETIVDLMWLDIYRIFTSESSKLALADCQALKEIIAYNVKSLKRNVILMSDYRLAIARVTKTGFI